MWITIVTLASNSLTTNVMAQSDPNANHSSREKIRVLIIDGQNNHQWRQTTPVLQSILEEGSMFQVDVATAPSGKDLGSFSPRFSDYQVVVSNYNGQLWSSATRSAFLDYVRNGGGFVAVHAANNAFPDWPEYNQIIGLGGWGGRNEKSGPYVRFRDDKIVLDTRPGPGGGHGPKHEFLIAHRNAEHPITKGLPKAWRHTSDELYHGLRGPAKNLTVLATAYSDKTKGGTGEHEPMLFTVAFEKGRIFHTTLGHDTVSMNCQGFAVTLRRGVEWAATGNVSQELPKEFPTAERCMTRRGS
jgi:type 1 glutamine amidotransferase